MNPGTSAEGLQPLSIRSLRDMRPVELGPWDASDLIRLVVCNLAGVILVGIGWYQASGQAEVRSELTWLELGILGVAVAVVENLMWVLGGRRHVGLAWVTVLPSPLRPKPARPASSRASGSAAGRASGSAATSATGPATSPATRATGRATSPAASAGPGPAPQHAAAAADRPLLASARMTRYHRPGCPLVAGKDVSAATAAEHRAAGRGPCELCEP